MPLHSLRRTLPRGRTWIPVQQWRGRADLSAHAPTGSARLRADAEREAAEEPERVTRSSTSTQMLADAAAYAEPSWTGDESTRDAVLRMLMDKYKPLRTGVVKSADTKLKKQVPHARPSHPVGQILNDDSIIISPTSTINTAISDTTINGEHKPWLVTFKTPSHATIKLMQFPPSSSSRSSASLDPDAALAQDRSARLRSEKAQRLNRARESTLDYRIGSSKKAGRNHVNPVSLKGWNSLIEDRIERARLTGFFNNVPGRGKPIERDDDERNPFIAREEFLMNRIVKRQGAAPPWVDLQSEVDSAIQTFRRSLRESWIRRAIRILTLTRPAHTISLNLEDISGFRDSEWIARETPYHTVSLDDINGLIRKYNTVAPYAVRKPYLTRNAELDRTYTTCGEEILRSLEARAQGAARDAASASDPASSEHSSTSVSSVSTSTAAQEGVGFRAVMREIWRSLSGEV